MPSEGPSAEAMGVAVDAFPCQSQPETQRDGLACSYRHGDSSFWCQGCISAVGLARRIDEHTAKVAARAVEAERESARARLDPGPSTYERLLAALRARGDE